MIKLTVEQKQALKKLYTRQSWDDEPRFKNYMALRRAVIPAVFGGYILIDMGYILLGIEPNGYTHS